MKELAMLAMVVNGEEVEAMSFAKLVQDMTEIERTVVRLEFDLRLAKHQQAAFHDRFEEIQRTDPVLASMGIGLAKIDKRKKFNPIKNLRISAAKAFTWARSSGREPWEAQERARVAVLKLARKKFLDHPDIEPFLRIDILPPSVENYIITSTELYESDPTSFVSQAT